MKVLIASTNAGKVGIYSAAFKKLGIECCGLNDLPPIDAPEENGKTALENAVIKAEYYHKHTGLPVVANDSALIIDRLPANEQPGVFVRRYNGRDLTDEEMVEVFIERLNRVGGESEGHYEVGLACIDEAGKLHTLVANPKRYFINKPCKTKIKGYPLDSLSFIKQYNKYRSEVAPEELNESEGEEFKKQEDLINKVFKK